MDYANEIKSMVSMPEMMEQYGFRLNKAGFCKCPFHSERSASFKAYPGQRGFYCFGCHANGSVIDFVMKFFGLSFGDAIKKINEDFSLFLPIGEKLDRRKQLDLDALDPPSLFLSPVIDRSAFTLFWNLINGSFFDFVQQMELILAFGGFFMMFCFSPLFQSMLNFDFSPQSLHHQRKAARHLPKIEIK